MTGTAGTNASASALTCHEYIEGGAASGIISCLLKGAAFEIDREGNIYSKLR
jgi:hypothetical protein